MDKRGPQWIGTPQIKGSTESMRMMLLTFSLIGLQFTWGIEMTYCTPYLLQLGMTKSRLSLVWIAGPLSGLIMQPIVGIYADRSKNKYGRRRPIMIVGAVIVSICLLILGWAGEIVGHFVSDKETKREATIVTAVFMIYVLDFAINAVQSSCRSLIVDQLPIPKQQLGSAWASRMVAVGHLIGYGAGALNLHSVFGNAIGDTQFKQLIVIAAIALLVAVGVTCWATTERVLVSDGMDGHNKDVWSTFAQLFHTTRHLPNRIQAVCWVQFWSWIGWFPFLFYSTTWVGETYLRYEAPASARASKDTLGDIGRLGSTSLIVFSIVTFLGSLTFPALVQSPEDTTSTSRSTFTPRPHRFLAPILKAFPGIGKPSLLTAWLIGHLVFSSAMFFAPMVTSVHFATILVAACGIPWALASWAPFTFMGVEINRLGTKLPTTTRSPSGSAELDEVTVLHLRQGSVSSSVSTASSRAAELEGTSSSTGELAGVYLGILNLYTTVPQFIATMIGWVVFQILEPGKSAELSDEPDKEAKVDVKQGPNAIAVCLFIGAICSVVAAFATRRLKYVR